MPEITVRGLSKTFGKAAALSDVAFSVRDKEFLTLLGPSGCGKTTTLMSIAGFQRPDEGLISCGERAFFDGTRNLCLAAEDRNLDRCATAVASATSATVTTAPASAISTEFLMELR